MRRTNNNLQQSTPSAQQRHYRNQIRKQHHSDKVTAGLYDVKAVT